ncbi:hypothetical protein GCM10009425_05210 [Pseudomonas asuensis]|uniref:Uncharacterized protein n=1 Tax=Pseudomonas asuensis TaxID=1825787 RepID=A0ABQ2GIN3_9PSED|nr:hypothetical protein GCM10009425_05210 [Pseudomonas asuensis]
MAALGDQGFNVCLQASAAAGVMTGKAKNDGTSVVCIHGKKLITKQAEQRLRSAV